MVKAILGSQEDGIFVLRIMARRPSKVNLVPRHATMYHTTSHETGDIRDSGNGSTILAFRGRQAQRDAAPTAYEEWMSAGALLVQARKITYSFQAHAECRDTPRFYRLFQGCRMR
jgi:hypothetical protein